MTSGAKFLLRCLGVAFLCASASVCASYPVKPIRMIVAYPPGGGTDILARAIAQRLTEALGQPVVVDNRPGANGNIGSNLVAKAPSDGYTLLMATANIAVNPALYREMPYHPMRDFAPIALIADTPEILTVHPSLAVNSVEDLVALARSKPGKLNFGSNGIGSLAHLSAELLKTKAEIAITHIAYRGAGIALSALLSDEVQFMFVNPLAVLPHLDSGRLRALAITAAKRSPILPGVPTMEEAGLRDYEVVAWYGIVAPAATPSAVIALLNRDICTIVAQPEMRAWLAKQIADPAADTSQQFSRFIESETNKWAEVINASGARLD